MSWETTVEDAPLQSDQQPIQQSSASPLIKNDVQEQLERQQVERQNNTVSSASEIIYNKNAYPMQQEEKANPNAYPMGFGTYPVNPGIVDPYIASARAMRFDYALSPKSPGPNNLYRQIVLGNEDGIRNSALIDAKFDSDKAKRDILTKYAVSPPNEDETQKLVNMYTRPSTEINLKTIIERKFAERITSQSIALDNMRSYNYAQVENQQENYSDHLSHGQEYIAKQQILRNKIDLVDDKLKGQPWLTNAATWEEESGILKRGESPGWLHDELQYIAALGFLETIKIGTGTQRMRYYNNLWAKTPEEFNNAIETDLEKYKGNPHLQKQYLHELLGYTSTDAVLDNLWAGFNAATIVGPVGVGVARRVARLPKGPSDLELLRRLQTQRTEQTFESAFKIVPQEEPSGELIGPRAPSVRSGDGFNVGDQITIKDVEGKPIFDGPKTIKDIRPYTTRIAGVQPYAQLRTKNGFDLAVEGHDYYFPTDQAVLVSKGTTNGVSNLRSTLRNLAQATSQREIDPLQVLDIGSSEIAAQHGAVNEAKGWNNIVTRAAGAGQQENVGKFFSQLMDMTNPAQVMKGSRSLSSNAARENFISTIFDAGNNVLDQAYINPLHINEYTQAELDSIFHQAEREISRRFPSLNQRVLRVQHLPAEDQLAKRDIYAIDIGPAPGKWFETAEEAQDFAKANRMASAKITTDTGGGYFGGSIKGEQGEALVLPENGKYAIRLHTSIDATRNEVRNMLGLNMSPGGISQKGADDVTKGLGRTFRYLPNWWYSLASKKDLIAQGISKYMDVAATTQGGIEKAAKQMWTAIDSLEGTAKLPFAKFRDVKEGTERSDFIRYLSAQRDKIQGGKVGRFDNTVPEFEANWLDMHHDLPNERITTAYFAYRMLNDLDYIGLNLGIYRDKVRNAVSHVRLPFKTSGSSYISPDGTEAVPGGFNYTEPMEGKFIGKSVIRDLPIDSRQPANVAIWNSDLSQYQARPLYRFDKKLRERLDKEGYNQVIQVHPENAEEAFSKTKGLVREKTVTGPFEEGAQPQPIPGVEKTLENMRDLRRMQRTPAQFSKAVDALIADKNIPGKNTTGYGDIQQYYTNLKGYITGSKNGIEKDANAIVTAYNTLTGSKMNKAVPLEDLYNKYLEIANKRFAAQKAGTSTIAPRVVQSPAAIGKGALEDYIKTPQEFRTHIQETYGRKVGSNEPISNLRTRPLVWMTSEGERGTLVSMSPHTPEIPTTIPVSGESIAGQRLTDTRVHFILMKEQPKIEDLPFQQLPYRAGGHLQVQNEWMISQPKIVRAWNSPNTFEHVYYSDNNIMGARWESDAKGYARNLDQARIIYNGWKAKTETTASAQRRIAKLMPVALDESQGRLQGVLPGKFKFDAKGQYKKVPITWDDFVGMFEGPNKFLNPELPIVHRPLNQNSMDFHNLANMTDKSGNQLFPNLRNFTDSEHSLYKSSLNLRFATERGDHIASIRGTGGSLGSKYNPAYNVVATDYVDPLVALNNSFNKTTRDSYLSEFKFKAAENYVQAFKDIIDKPIDVLRADPFRALTDRTWAPFTTDAKTQYKDLYKTAYAYQKATTEFLNIPSQTDKWTQYMKALIKDNVYRSLGERPANWIDKIMPWDKLDQPANAIKMWTFDMSKMFDPRQLWTMGTTAAHNLAVLGPTRGMRALTGGMWMSMIGRGASEDMINSFAQKAANMGYEHFAEAYKALERTGWKIVGRETSDINNYMFSPAFRDSYLNQIRDAGRVFFKMGESYSRMSAWAGAFDEWRGLNPTKRVTDRDIADILYRADTLNVNMTSSAAASWQKGLVSIPLQFASWNVRLAEQLLPGYSTRLTGREKLQAFLTYSALYGIPVGLTGSLGVWPVHKSIAKYSLEQYGDGVSKDPSMIENMINPRANLIAETMNRGLIQTISAHTLGDYNFSEKFGSTGISPVINLVKGDKTAWASMIGPTGNLLSNYYDALSPFARWSTGVFDNTNDRFPLTPNDFTQLARTASGANNAIKAWTAYNTGTYTSNHGVDITHNFSPTDAVTMMMTGALPQHVQDTFLMSESDRDLSNTQKYYKQSIIERMRLAWKAAANGDFDNATDYQKQAKTYIIAGGYTQQQYYQLYKEAMIGYESMEERVHMQFIKLHPNAMKRIIDGQ